MRLAWKSMDTAPLDREILLFGSDYDGREMVAFGSWCVEKSYAWETLISNESELHKKRVERETTYWGTDGGGEIFPTLWADVEHPMRPRLTPDMGVSLDY